MASKLLRGVSRREFMEVSGAMAGVGLLATHSAAQEPGESFSPCFDMPVRTAPNSPSTPTPVEQALDFAGTHVANTPAMTPDIRARVDRYQAFLPSDSGPSQAAASSRWDQSTLRVRFNGGSRVLIQKVLDIAAEWSIYTGLKFQESSHSASEIRVGFAPNLGHWSYIGKGSLVSNVRGNSMNLAVSESTLETDRYHRAVVLHEFGHAIGLIHEHLSPGSGGPIFDRAKTLAYYRSLRIPGWDDQKTIHNVLSPYSAGNLIRFTDFDRHSIMVYQTPAFITTNGIGTERTYSLSSMDKEFAGVLYGHTPTPVPTKVEPAESAPKAIVINGDPIGGKLSPAIQLNIYTFELQASQVCTIRTTGYTQVAIKLLKDESPVALNVRTPDLVNITTTGNFETGKYRVEIAPVHSGGVGEYRIGITSP